MLARDRGGHVRHRPRHPGEASTANGSIERFRPEGRSRLAVRGYVDAPAVEGRLARSHEDPETPVRVLVVEDERAIAASVRAALARDGWAADVVHDGLDAVRWAATYPYDLIVLDLVLPGIDGFEVCRRLRERGCPAAVLMLTALDEVDQRVTGLDSGADDYLTKPFAMTELLARTRALRRRSVIDRHPSIRVAGLELDPTRMEVMRHGSTIRVTAREYSLLEFLARHPGQVFSQDQLIDGVWDADYAGGSNVVEVFIRSLRRKIDGGRRDGIIETVRGAGYRLRP